MKRREFGERFVAGAIAAGIARPACLDAAPAHRKNTVMHVGADYHSVAGSGISSKENLEYTLRHGVKHLTMQVRKRGIDGGWDLDDLKKTRDDCDKYGVTLEAIRMDAD